MKSDKVTFKYSSYVQDIMGPMCFDYGFGPFRWVCTSGKPSDLKITDDIACLVLEDLLKDAPVEIQQQMKDNIQWIKGAQENNLVVGSQARILYADSQGRIAIAKAFNKAIKEGVISAPIVLGEVINGGFGLTIDGSIESEDKLSNMLFWDVNNGIARRNWARNEEAIFAIKREMKRNSKLDVTIPYSADDQIVNKLID